MWCPAKKKAGLVGYLADSRRCVMSGKAKFDKEAAFMSIIGAGREPEAESVELQPAEKGKKGKNKNRVQRSYFLDRDID